MLTVQKIILIDATREARVNLDISETPSSIRERIHPRKCPAVILTKRRRDLISVIAELRSETSPGCIYRYCDHIFLEKIKDKTKGKS